VTVHNVAPTLGPLSVSPELAELGTHSVAASLTFDDPGVLDTHDATIDWGDGTTSPGEIGESAGETIVSGEHAYTAAGVYTVALAVTDNSGGTSEAVFEFVVVYDPGSGFVTGGGWIDSPAGACQLTEACAGETGKANFGFVSRYRRGATTPSGNTEFNFSAGDLNFHSEDYEWLVIAGPTARFKGRDTINGTGDYGFMLNALDAELTPRAGTDRFRIKIWDRANGDLVVYDNEITAAEGDDPTTAIGGGSIRIHAGN
jgi:PKD repeat protein